MTSDSAAGWTSALESVYHSSVYIIINIDHRHQQAKRSSLVCLFVCILCWLHESLADAQRMQHVTVPPKMGVQVKCITPHASGHMHQVTCIRAHASRHMHQVTCIGHEHQVTHITPHASGHVYRTSWCCKLDPLSKVPHKELNVV